jgi:hypothetical protein
LRALSPVGIRLATEAVALQFGIVV